jgi:hydroxyacylglutathione hydrolase
MYQDEILKDLFFIERGYLNGNHFVYRSKAPVLIDTGYVADFNETARLIGGLGISISDVTLIINTHTHCDHIGGNKAIQEASGCDIALHKVGKYFIDSRDDWSTWWRYYRQEADFFNCTQSLEDGQMIGVGPYEFQVIYTPGHASDGIVLYNGKEKILLSSDTLWENDMAVITIRVEGSKALFHMQESLEKLESLDVKMVYPGHGPPFSDIKRALSTSKEKLGGYFEHPEEIGDDLIKKIMIFTLLMKRAIGENALFPYLMDTYWFRETIDLYFNAEYELKYNELIRDFLKRGIIRRKNGNLFTIIKP